jgi:hypothetical protein
MKNQNRLDRHGRNFSTVICIFSLCLLLFACAGSPFRTSMEAEGNRANLVKLHIGQDRNTVLKIMGRPYKTESYVRDGRVLDFWLYLTEGKSITDRRLTDANFTPLAFEDGILKGWGRNYYDNVLRIKKDVTIESK